MVEEMLLILLSPAGVAAGVGSVVGVMFLAVGFRMLRPKLAEPPPDEDAAREDPFVAGSNSEQRRAVRRKGTYVSVDLRDGDDENRQWTGWVIDRSTSGLCLGSARKVSAGAIVRVRVTDCAESMPWFDIEVRHCEQGQQGYVLGCKFIKTPTWNFQMLFG